MAKVLNDRFGNPSTLIACKPNKNGYPTGYVKLKGQLYQVAISENKKYGGYWAKITKLESTKKAM